MSAIENGANLEASQAEEKKLPEIMPVKAFFTTNESGDFQMIDAGPSHPGYPPVEVFSHLSLSQLRPEFKSKTTPPARTENENGYEGYKIPEEVAAALD